MKNVLKLEELALFILSFILFIRTGISWWWFFILLLTPDISMIGYLFGTKPGAIIYNIFHHRGLAILIALAGFYWNINLLYISGIILFGHSSMDRLFGYGLKYAKGFKFTHLGEIGR